MTTPCSLSILAARSGFIRGHCGKVAPKAPPGRATGASAKAAILSQHRAASKLSIFDIGQCERYCPSSSSGSAVRPVFSRRRVPVINSKLCAAMASGRCGAVLIFNQPQVCPADFKGGVITLEERPCAGTLDCVAPVLDGEQATLPLTRHCQVVWGLCPMTVSHERTCQPRLSGGQKH